MQRTDRRCGHLLDLVPMNSEAPGVNLQEALDVVDVLARRLEDGPLLDTGREV